MSKGVIGVIIAVVVLAGGYFLLSDNESFENLDNRFESRDVMEKDDDDAMMEDSDNMDDGDAMENSVDLPIEGVFPLDSSASTLHYSAERIVGRSHTGTVSLFEGTIEFIAGELASGGFVIDMTTITESENNTRFLGHLSSADFFDVETYPTSKFIITNLIKNSDGTYQVTGDLTLLDSTNEITFPATLTNNEDSANVEARITIDRTRWGVIYDSDNFLADLVGDSAIRDEVPIRLNLTFIK
jgi:polyisoprenoid-binding protein YceI